MRNKTFQRVYLLGCPAQVMYPNDPDFSPVCLIGLFDVVEFMPYEPAAYVHEPMYLVAPADFGPHTWPDGSSPPDEPEIMYTVSVDHFLEDVDPKGHGREIVQEREMAFAAERDFA